MLIQNENIKNIPSLPNCSILLRLDEPLAGFFIMEFHKNLSLENLTCYDDEGIFHVEEWANIEEYYQISTFGRIKNLKRKIIIILKAQLTQKGYLFVSINYKTRYIHILVGMTFIDNPENKPEINHIDLIKTHNYKWNLGWVTHRENLTHYYNLINTTSKYIGVYWAKETNKWTSSIRVNGRLCRLGYFEIESDANNSYQKALKSVNEGTFIAPTRRKKPTSIYKGIHWDKIIKKWVANIRIDSKRIYIGIYSTEL